MTPLTLTPEIKAQIHPTMNEGLDVDSLAAKSSQKIWWVCQEHGHPYTSTPRHKSEGVGCAVCSGKQISQGFNDLATLRPDIAAQWHPAKNGDLKPTMVSKTYSKKVWWKCNLGHEFESLPVNRRNTDHCSVCVGNVIVAGFNDAATLLPHLVDKFHPTKNGEVSLTAIGKSFPKKLWWVPECGHEVEVKITNCYGRIPCSICKGFKTLIGFNDLATTHPDIVALWHPTKNLPDTPQTITKGSNTKRWWICSEGHEDFALPNNVIMKNGRCSYCAGNKLTIGVNDFQTLYPEVSKEWHPTRNGDVLPSMIASSTHRKYWWKCNVCAASWDAPPANRGSKKIGCPVCAGQKLVEGINDLATIFPTVAALWHPSMNVDLKPTQVTAGTPRLVWWKCADGDEWQARINGMAKSFGKGQIGCAICYRKKLPSGSKSLAEMRPDIAKDWDYDRNDKTPESIAHFSNKTVWWTCPSNVNHSWQTTVANRTLHEVNCSICWKEGSGSQAEEDLALFLESLGLKIERKVITMLENRKELDIYLPEYNVAVEYNGLHWHSEKYRDRKYHINKYQECKEKGITLVQIWEDDWLDRKETVQFQLAERFDRLAALNELTTGIPHDWFVIHQGHQLTVEAITALQAQTFLESIQIKDLCKGSHYFGLMGDSGIIVAILVVSETDKQGEYVLARYAVKGIAIDSFAKLIEYATSIVKPTKLVAYSDNTNPSDGLYANHNFTNAGLITEDYMYVQGKKRIHKSAITVHGLNENANMVYFDRLSESKIEEQNSLSRIWDAGKTCWIL